MRLQTCMDVHVCMYMYTHMLCTHMHIGSQIFFSLSLLQHFTYPYITRHATCKPITSHHIISYDIQCQFMCKFGMVEKDFSIEIHSLYSFQYYILYHHITSRHVMSYIYHTWHDVTWRDVTWYNMTWHFLSYLILSFLILSYPIRSYHIISYHIISCHHICTLMYISYRS